MWLVRLANPAEQDRDKVYALKVLRKAEGKLKVKQKQWWGDVKTSRGEIIFVAKTRY